MLQQQPKICRFCLFENAEYEARPLLHLFQNFKQDNIKKKVEDCLNIKLNLDDKIPPIICQSCLEKVNYFSDFLELSAKSEKHLRLIYGLDRPQSSQDSNRANRTAKWLNEGRLKTCRTESDFSVNYKAKRNDDQHGLNLVPVQRGESSVALKCQRRKRDEAYTDQQNFKKPRIQCQICNSKVLAKNMGAHLHKHAEKFRTSPPNAFKSPASGKNPNKKISCKICQRIFKSENLLTAHMKKMHETKKISFSAHKKRRSDKRSLKIAVKNLAKTRRFRCRLCEEKFTSLKALREHLSTHNKSTKECPKCRRQFLSRKHYNKHILQCLYGGSTQKVPRKTSSLPTI